MYIPQRDRCVLGNGNMQILQSLSETGKPPNYIFINGVADLDLYFHYQHRLFPGIFKVVKWQNDANIQSLNE